MNRKSYYVGITFALLIGALVSEIFYLKAFYSLKSASKDEKKAFVSLTSMPDLSLATDSRYIRHRSLASIFSIYPHDANLLDDDPLTYTISDTKIAQK